MAIFGKRTWGQALMAKLPSLPAEQQKDLLDSPKRLPPEYAALWRARFGTGWVRAEVVDAAPAMFVDWVFEYPGSFDVHDVWDTTRLQKSRVYRLREG